MSISVSRLVVLLHFADYSSLEVIQTSIFAVRGITPQGILLTLDETTAATSNCIVALFCYTGENMDTLLFWELREDGSVVLRSVEVRLT